MGFKFWILKLRGQYNLLKTKSISHKIFLGPNVQFFGLKNIEIKDNCTIGDNSLLTVNNRSNKDKQLTISSNVYLGRDNFISVGKSVYISDYCIFGNKCSIICSDHVFDNPLIPYALSGNSFEKRIIIGVNCWFGHGVFVLGNVKIGHGSIIGANTIITKDIPPFSMVVGNPARIIKTYNFTTNKWEKDVVFNESIFMIEDEYLRYLRNNNGDTPLAHYSASSRLGHL